MIRAVENLVEKIASNHVDYGFTDAIVPREWNAVETSCTMAYVMGTFSMNAKSSNDAGQFNVPLQVVSYLPVSKKNTDYLIWSGVLHFLKQV